ncbi:MAG TPA: HD domain-containing protein [Streptosporangiaceae bacterium]|nr:HD domain-containing protein [Streptosporangiaceae bacterium]
MSYATWAEQIARNLLSEPLPRRWAHVQAVAATARTLAPVLGGDADLVIAAGWLHDIGYAPALAGSGFHPLDGARYLRDAGHAGDVLCRLVANHSCAITEAAGRGLAGELSREFRPARRDLADALIYCDMTTGPDGQRMTVEQRLADIGTRYGPGDPVSQAITRSAPLLIAATGRVTRKLARSPAARRREAAQACPA